MLFHMIFGFGKIENRQDWREVEDNYCTC